MLPGAGLPTDRVLRPYRVRRPTRYKKGMELHLDALQTTTLRELVEIAWRDLRYEIADTDNARFKAGLRERERVISSILEQLRAEVPSPQP